jgi:hypothetical protein
MCSTGNKLSFFGYDAIAWGAFETEGPFKRLRGVLERLFACLGYPHPKTEHGPPGGLFGFKTL